MTTSDFLRIASLAAVLLAGSCTSQPDDMTGIGPGFAPTDNYPIAVEPGSQMLRVSYAGPGVGLSPEDGANFDSFVADYLAHGDGAISVTVPQGPGAQAEISYFGERLNQEGIDRTRILVGTRNVANGDGRVEVNFVGYVARTKPCGNWSSNVAEDGDNLNSPNFGCAVQQNIAAMVANPHDLVAPRPMSASDATRRTTVMGNYEKGTPTAAQQTSQQSGAVSDVASH